MLKGKTAVITGGSRGIGAAITDKLASMGANVAVLYSTNEEQAKSICSDCRSAYNIQAMDYRCDVSDYDDTEKTVAKIKSDFGTIDILINNAGITRDSLCVSMKEADFDTVIDINLKGVFNMIRHCSRIFIRNKSGKIVNISSVAGLIGNPGQINYSASKAGIIGMTKTIAKELAPCNITCNAIAPGFISTAMTENFSNHEKVSAMIPLGRLGKPEEVAEAAAFLITSDYITGVVLRVDGGIAI